MFKLIKYLKNSIVSIIFIVILLVIQAMCDLSLPEFTSNIVNIGIQQGGVENATPNIIRKSEYDNIILFTKDDDKTKIENNYKILSKNDLSDEDYQNYLKEYPELKNGDLYKLETKDKETIESLNSIMGKSILISYGMKDPEQSKELKKEMEKNLPQGGKLPDNIDLINIFKTMPKEQFSEIKKQMYEKFDEMPESIVNQSAVSFVKGEYDAIGIDTDKLQTSYILRTGGIMLLIAMVSMMATVAVVYIASRVAANLGHSLRNKVFGKVINFSNAELEKFSTASLITRSTNDIQQIQTLMVMLLRIVFYAPILGIGGIIKVLGTDTSMAWIIAVAFLAIMSLVLVLFGFALPRFKIIQKLVDKVNLVTRETLTGMLVIRAFGTEKHEEKRFDNANRDLTKTNLFVNRIMTIMMPGMMFIMNGISVLIVWVGSHSIDSGNMQVGDMMAFIQYTMQIIMAFLMISMLSVMLPRAAVSAGRIDEVLTTDFSILDPAENKGFDRSESTLLEFKDVTFRYPDAKEDVIKNISFTAKPGETTAFIGSTGAGKSTVINLIPRFFDVTKGEILVNGVNIKDINQKDLRDIIGYVPQKGILFSGTIESNIKYGKKSATLDEVKKAAEIAQSTDFIEAKPEKYESEIAQGGSNVSGGQKQRLSIARAIAKNPSIYIFDDSFSALDFKTDKTLRAALKKETKDSTVLIVAQRISTILNAEQIIVLDKGEIVGKGTHKELLENCEVYREIAKSQLSKEELAYE